ARARLVGGRALADDRGAVDEPAARAGGADVAERVLALHDGLVEALASSGLDEQVAGEWMAGLARTLAFPDAPREQRRPSPAVSADEDDAPLLRLVGGTDALDRSEERRVGKEGSRRGAACHPPTQ